MTSRAAGEDPVPAGSEKSLPPPATLVTGVAGGERDHREHARRTVHSLPTYVVPSASDRAMLTT
ncbi:hypothetical protein GCM10027063_45800 [Promicromonospora xylanilytica]